jgi:hypothetical protein
MSDLIRQWGFCLFLAITSVILIALNWAGLIFSMGAGRSYSWAPSFLCGFAGAIACLVCALPEVRYFAWVPLLMDASILFWLWWLVGRVLLRQRDPRTLLMLEAYREDSEMSDKLSDFVRQSIDEFLKSLTAEERLKGLPAEELRKRLSPTERVEGLPAEERLKGLSVEEEIRALSLQALEALTRKLKANGSSAKPQ